MTFNGSTFAKTVVQVENLYMPGHNLTDQFYDPRDTTTFNGADLDRLLASCVFLPDQLAQAESMLAAKRILVIHGRDHMGKKTLALKLARRLVPKHEIICRMSGALPKGVKINPAAVGEGLEGSGPKVFIFRDVLRHGNHDFTDFLTGLDTQALTTRLRAWDGYVLITATPQQLEGLQINLSKSGIALEYREPSFDVFTQVLRIQLLEREIGPDNHVGWALLEIDPSAILYSRLGTLPRLAQFLDQYLTAILHGELTLENALDRYGDLGRWFLQQLPRDNLLAWSHAVVLALLSFEQADYGVAWLDYCRFYEWFLPTLRASFPTDRKHWQGDLIHSDVAFFGQLKAQVLKDQHPVRSRVRFEQGRSMAGPLSQALFKDGHRIITPLLSLLKRALFEEADPDPEANKRGRERPSFVLMAKLLGRLGELDAQGVVKTLIREWINRPNGMLWQAIGLVIQGSYRSGNRTYIDACLNYLRDSEPGFPGKSTQGGERVNTQETGVEDESDDSSRHMETKKMDEKSGSQLNANCAGLAVAYVHLAQEEPAHAYEALVRLLGEYLLEAGGENPLNREYLQRFLFDSNNEKQHLALESVLEDLNLRGEYFLTILGAALHHHGTRFGPVSLLHGLFPYLQRWRAGERRERNRLPPMDWFLILLLLPEGLLDSWATPMPDPRRSRPRSSFNLIVIDIQTSERACLRLGFFLNQLYVQVDKCRIPAMKQPLKKAYFRHLRSWAIFAAEEAVNSRVVENLFVLLITQGGISLSHLVGQMLRGHPVFRDPDTPTGDFAKRVLARVQDVLLFAR
jgi:hypothetical protein